MGSSQGKKGGKKIGRNKKKCERYRAEGRRKKNKELKILRRELKFEKAKDRRLKRETS